MFSGPDWVLVQEFVDSDFPYPILLNNFFTDAHFGVRGCYAALLLVTIICMDTLLRLFFGCIATLTFKRFERRFEVHLSSPLPDLLCR
jgi:hypothetical protein